MAPGLAAVVAVRQRAEEGVVLVRGEVIPDERSQPAFNRPSLPVSTIAMETEQRWRTIANRSSASTNSLQSFIFPGLLLEYMTVFS